MEDQVLQAYVTNLGKYNEGELVGEWVKFPTTKEEMQQVFDRIGINEEYEEFFITDYDCNIYGLTEVLGEYTNLDALNYLCGRIEELSDYQREVFENVLQSAVGLGQEQDIDGLINLTYNLDRYEMIGGIEDEADLGRYYAEQILEGKRDLLGDLANYIDYEAYGSDVQINESGMFGDHCYVRCVSNEWDRYYDGSLEDIPDEYRLSGGEEPEKEKTITALVVEPGKKPYVKEIENDIKALQNEVGGLVQCVYPFQDRVAILCNDEGKINGLPLNRAMRDDSGEVYDILAGTVLVVGLTEEDFGSLTPEQIDTYSKLYETPEAFVKVGDSLLILPVQPEEEQSRGKAANMDQAVPESTYEIYQLKDTPEAEKLAFMNSSYLESIGASIVGSNYEKVYEGRLAENDALDSIYMKFNIDHPEDFRGHSLSVSDVVVLHQDGQDTAHFVDDFGFKELPEFIEQVQAAERETSAIDQEVRNLEIEAMSVPIDPDKSLSDQDMVQYGYEWAGMLPVGGSQAEKLYEAGLSMYKLYPNDTEAAVENKADLAAHKANNGMFGVEKDVWMAFIEKNSLAKVEELLEDDYGMIDGIINNGSKSQEEEKKGSIHEKLKAGKEKVKEYDQHKEHAPKQDKKKDIGKDR